jgi:hypothetical protein
MGMFKFILAVVLVSVVAGCVTEGPTSEAARVRSAKNAPHQVILGTAY